MNQSRQFLINASAHDIPLPDGMIHTVVTSPPYYSLRKYQGEQLVDWPAVSYSPMPGLPPLEMLAMRCALGLEPTPEAYIGHLLRCFREVWRVCRDDSVVWCIMGDSYAGSGDRSSGGDLMGIPHRLMFALQADGWLCRNDVVWAKVAPMPESVSGWRWERHQVKTSEPLSTAQHRSGDPSTVNGYRQTSLAATYTPCPGCDKCRETDGYVLRRGSWRHTRAHETVLMCAKGMGYFADQERVREKHKPESIKRMKSPFKGFRDRYDGNNPKIGNFENYLDRPEGWGGVGGRNPRSVLTPKPESFPGSHYACVDTETECLTIGGWKRYDQLREGMPIFTFNMETQQLEIQPITALAMYEYKGNLVSVFGRNTNMVMTPNHRCIVYRRLHRRGGILGPPQIERADNLKAGMQFRVAAELSDDGLLVPNDPPEFFELLGWVVTDGSLHDSGGISIYQSQSKTSCVDRLDALMEIYGDEMTKVSRARHGTQEHTYSLHGELRKRVRLFLPDKSRIPEHFLTLPIQHASAFLAGIVGGDGHIRDDGRISIIQKHKGMLDMVQAMFLRTGRSCILSQRKNKQWTAFVSNKTTRHFRNSTSSLVRDDYAYHGIIWCPNVPNGTWIARRGGRPFITGNTFPRTLIAPLLRATAPTRVCSVCGAPWAPVVERTSQPAKSHKGSYFDRGKTGDNGEGRVQQGERYETAATGHRPTCNHDADPIPGWALDPFVGTFTTGEVCAELGVNAIGLDISLDYLDEHAKPRIGLTPSGALETLPLFAELEDV